jgi:hypothetical protein
VLTPERLHEGIVFALRLLDDPELPPDQRVPNVAIEDRVFVAGLMPFGHPALDMAQGAPRFLVSPPDVQSIMRGERGPIRHYQSVRITSWNGEVAVTVYAHFGIQAHMMYVEFIATVLPAIKPKYQAVDTYERLTGGATAMHLLKSVGRMWPTLVMAPVNVAAALADVVRRELQEWRQRSSINARLAFDYGARSSARELASSQYETVYFQGLDATQTHPAGGAGLDRGDRRGPRTPRLQHRGVLRSRQRRAQQHHDHRADVREFVLRHRAGRCREQRRSIGLSLSHGGPCGWRVASAFLGRTRTDPAQEAGRDGEQGGVARRQHQRADLSEQRVRGG